MSREVYKWQGRIKAVEQEYEATHLALERLLAMAKADPTQLSSSVARAHVRDAFGSAEATYIVRLFAIFEMGLRDFWATAKQNDPPSRMRDLMNSIGSNRSIPHDVIEKAHDLREYRNSLLHEVDDPPSSIKIADARSRLCRFLGFLPPTW